MYTTALIQPLSAIFTSPVMNKNSKKVVKVYRGHENIVALKRWSFNHTSMYSFQLKQKYFFLLFTIS